jgi:predicted alternative tryptophan synthase beta-subunit
LFNGLRTVCLVFVNNKKLDPIMNAAVVEKEAISNLQFVDYEVLNDRESIARRQHKLMRAVTLGNLYKAKCKVYFVTSEGEKAVETTLWALTDNYIMIKGGRVIPVQCISGLEGC